MKQNLTLTITSLLSILFLTFHFTSDTLRARAGSPEAGGSTLVAAPILVLLLYGTVVLAGRRSGSIIMLIGGIIAFAMPIMHVSFSAGMFQGVLAKGNGDFLVVWTLHMLGLTGIFQCLLAARALSGRKPTAERARAASDRI